MLTRNFQVGDVFGTVRKFNPRGGPMDAAVIVSLLRKVYPETEKISEEITMDSILPMTRLGSIDTFAKLAVHIVEIQGLGFEWPAIRGGSPEQWDKAYEDYLHNDTELWDDISRLAGELDNPNGVEAGILTPEQERDPLSSNGVVSMSKA